MAKEDFGRLGFKDSVSNNTTVNFTEHSAD